MGNSSSSSNNENNMEAAGYACNIASSPTKRIEAPVAYCATCIRTPAQNSLPKSIVVVLRLSRIDFIEATAEMLSMHTSELSDHVKRTRPFVLRSVSYFKIQSWSHSPSTFVLKVLGDTTDKSIGEFSFKMAKGTPNDVAETIALFVDMVMADREPEEQEARMEAKERRWKVALNLQDGSPCKSAASPTAA